MITWYQVPEIWMIGFRRHLPKRREITAQIVYLIVSISGTFIVKLNRLAYRAYTGRKDANYVY